LPFWSLKPPDEAVPEAAAAEIELEPELSKMMGDGVLPLPLPDTLDFDGLFNLITTGDAEVAAAFDEVLALALPDASDFDGLFNLITAGNAEVAAAAATAAVFDEVESSEQSLEDLSPLRFLEPFPDGAPVAVAVLSLDDADALDALAFLVDEDEEDPFADDGLDAPLAPLTPGSDVISVN